MTAAVVKERFQRVLGRLKHTFNRSRYLKVALLGGVLLLIGLLAAFSDHSPDLAHVRVGVLSGDPQKNYYEIINRLAAEAQRQKGRIDNIPSAGSVENISRLVDSRATCDVHFALVQEGLDWPAGSPLELIGRLPEAEFLVFLGPEADQVKALTDLRGMRIGIGPIGSGTEHVARQVLAPLAELDLSLSTQGIEEQLVKLERGELDLGAMVINEDAPLLAEAVRDRGLQILSLPNADALARRLPFKRVGHIVAGQYDPVRVLPREAKDVLQVDTLIVGNRCARRSVTQGFMTVVDTVFPDFVRYNRATPNRTGLPLAPAAHSYFEHEGPDLVGVYAPWVIDIMPTATWVQLILGISLLFNAMGLWHRFQVSRLDKNRMRTESVIPLLFGPGVTVGEIAEMAPSEKHRTPEARKQLDTILDQLATLLERTRRESQSVLVPMGEEIRYHDLEKFIDDLLYALRTFRDRLGP
jgi:TRAP-type uncharacterized transport system substrate-binding protein